MTSKQFDLNNFFLLFFRKKWQHSGELESMLCPGHFHEVSKFSNDLFKSFVNHRNFAARPFYSIIQKSARAIVNFRVVRQNRALIKYRADKISRVQNIAWTKYRAEKIFEQK